MALGTASHEINVDYVVYVFEREGGLRERASGWRLVGRSAGLLVLKGEKEARKEGSENLGP